MGRLQYVVILAVTALLIVAAFWLVMTSGAVTNLD